MQRFIHCDEQQDDHAAGDLVVDGLPLDLDVHQVAGQVVTRVLAVILDLGEDVDAEVIDASESTGLLGEPLERVFSSDLDVSRMPDMSADDHIAALERNLGMGWGGFSGSICPLNLVMMKSVQPRTQRSASLLIPSISSLSSDFQNHQQSL